MSIDYTGPFIKKAYHVQLVAGVPTREASNPAFGTAFSDTVPAPLRRVLLVVQNQGTADIDLTLGPGSGLKLKVYVGQSISWENFNGGVTMTSAAPIVAAVIECYS